MGARLSYSLLFTVLCCAYALAQKATPLATPSPAPVDESTIGAISGSVVNESGQPCAGVQVFVRQLNTSNPGRTTTTDSEGNFHFNGLTSGLYVVSGSAPGYVQPQSDPNQLAPHYR